MKSAKPVIGRDETGKEERPPHFKGIRLRSAAEGATLSGGELAARAEELGL